MNAKKIVRLFTVISLSFLPTSVSGANGMDIKPAYVSDSTETKLPRVCKKEGFFSLPGMDSLCWKVGGVLSYIGVLEGPEFIRPGAGAAVGFGPNDLFPPSEGEGAGYLFSGRVLGRVNFDARSRFSYGSFRTFVEIEARADIKAGSPRSLDLRHAYVRLGDILFGKTTTTWAHLDSMPDYGSGVSLISDPGTRLLQIRYTQPFGSGLSLSLALEDSEPYLGENGGIGAIFGTHLNLRRFVKVSGLPFPALVFSLQLKKPSISAQISGVLLSRNVKWMNSPVETVREKAFRGWGLLAGVARSVPGFGEDRVGAIAFYTSGLDPEFTNSVTPLGKSYLFIWKDALSGKNIVSLDTFGLMAWVKHVWSDKFSTTLGAAYNNVSNNTDFYEFRNEVFTSSLFPKYASALFLHNSFEVFKNLKFAFDIVYEKRKFVSVGRRDFQSGFGAAFQLTYSF